MIKFCHHLTKLIIARIIVSLVFKKIIVRAAVLFSEILWLWLHRNKFCHYLAKNIITRVIVSSVLEDVLITIEIIVFQQIMTLVK